jgi:chromosome segregation ATPase
MEDLKIEEEKLRDLIKKNNNNIRKLTDDILQDKRKTEEEHKKIIEELSSQIKELENKQTEILKSIEEDKKEKMDTNDKDIAEKRRELDQLKTHYEETKFNHKNLEDKLKKEIDEIRSKNKKTENKRTKQKTELDTLQTENNKLEKQIRDMNNDRNEKEETLKDKNELKRKLDKDNQELEKFKYVLHYKIKELKHNKEPKERKIQQMEKKAKDMEREIKSCELGQANIIIELSTNHQVIKIHEEQISKTEKRIEELRRYKKLFQENLYNSMKRAKNHKDCKRELVLLKRNFLDKEKIENVEKPFESNHELQREFLEKNVDHYKGKINTMNKIFVNDHSKVMKEKRQLISIENQLEKERREIQEADTYKSEKVSGITKPKGKLKADVPRFPHPKKKKGEENDEEEQDELKLKNLAEELKAIVKEVQWYKYWGKKKELENMNKEKNDRKNKGIEGDEDYNNYEN